MDEKYTSEPAQKLRVYLDSCISQGIDNLCHVEYKPHKIYSGLKLLIYYWKQL